MILMLTAGITTKAANHGIIYTTPDGWTSDTYGTRNSAVSPRAIQLKFQNNEADNGKMLITWEYGIIENESNGKVFPVYESSDRGETWTSVGNVVETQNQSEENAGNRWGMECCPQLFELPSDVGEMKKGGIICIGCVCPKDLSATHFDMYYSEDRGRNWRYMSSLVTDGGRNVIDAPETLEIVMREKEGKRYLFVLNFGAQDVGFTLRKKAKLMYTGEKAEGGQKLSAYETAVYEVVDYS